MLRWMCGQVGEFCGLVSMSVVSVIGGWSSEWIDIDKKKSDCPSHHRRLKPEVYTQNNKEIESKHLKML